MFAELIVLFHLLQSFVSAVSPCNFPGRNAYPLSYRTERMFLVVEHFDNQFCLLISTPLANSRHVANRHERFLVSAAFILSTENFDYRNILQRGHHFGWNGHRAGPVITKERFDRRRAAVSFNHQIECRLRSLVEALDYNLLERHKPI